jgi:hypothetical protein
MKPKENFFAWSGLADYSGQRVKVSSSQLGNKNTPAIQISDHSQVCLSRKASLSRTQGRLVETLVGWFPAAFGVTEMKAVLIFVAKRDIAT